jgi:ATP-binding protein involved in chromosome partitioning
MEGKRVGLMDADVYGPNVPTMLGLTEGPRMETDPAHPERGELFVPPIARGVKVMSMGFLVPAEQPAIWRGPMLHSLVQQFCFKVQWGELDTLVVDMPPGTGDVQLSLAQLVPVSGAILVTTPQEVSLQDVRKAYAMFERVRVPVLGFIENMSWFECDGCEKKHFIFGEGGGERLAKKFGAELLARLPLRPEVRKGGDEGVPALMPELRELARGLEARFPRAGGVEIGKFN